MPKKNADAPASPARSSPRPSRTRATAADAAPRGTTTNSEPTHDEIAEAAYQRYLSRGGAHGQDIEDWVEAERHLRARRASR